MTSKQAKLIGADTRIQRWSTWALGVALCCAGLLGPRAASAQEFTLHVEPAAAFWVDQPQRDRFTPGFYGALRPGISLGPVVALQASYAFLDTPARGAYSENGTAHSFMLGIRVRPFGTLTDPAKQLGGLFADFDMGFVKTDNLGRFGFDIGIGYDFQPTSWLALGPVLRYTQIVQPNDVVNVDHNDGQMITLGLDLAFGRPYQAPAEDESGLESSPEPEPTACVQQAPPPVVETAPLHCADADGDGISDTDDRCPTQAGPAENFGCPTLDPCGGTPLVVQVQFDFDSAGLPARVGGVPQTMDPVLDAVATAIDNEPACRVCIVGYASEEGEVEHNQELSERRATAVRGYLTARGLNVSRMPTTGFGAHCQLVPIATRPLNRRVEFRRLDEGASCPTECTE